MLPLLAGIFVFGAVAITTVMYLIIKLNGDSVDREYEDQQQIKFLEEWKKKRNKPPGRCK